MGVSNSELFEHFERKEKECRRQFTLLRDQALTILRRKKKPGWENQGGGSRPRGSLGTTIRREMEEGGSDVPAVLYSDHGPFA